MIKIKNFRCNPENIISYYPSDNHSKIKNDTDWMEYYIIIALSNGEKHMVVFNNKEERDLELEDLDFKLL